MSHENTQDHPFNRWRDMWRRGRKWVIMVVVIVVLVVAARLTIGRPPQIMVAKVGRGDQLAVVEGTGTVTADTVANVASKITGRVERVFVDQGDQVQQGQILAGLDRTGLRHRVAVARAKLAAAQATAAERQREWDRERGLVKTRAVGVEEAQQYQQRYEVAQSAVEAAAAELSDAEYQLSLTQVPSLVNGVVIKRWVVPGDSVVPGQRMFTVADTHLIYVDANVDQSFTGLLKKGEAATVILRGRENHPLVGRVLRMDPQANAYTEETVAEVSFNLPADEFQLGQWANVFIQVGEAKGALTVPRAALIPMGNRKFVFAVGADNTLHRVAVKVLAQDPRSPTVAVLGDLQSGECVVLKPMGLRPGQKVRPISAQADPTPMAAGA